MRVFVILPAAGMGTRMNVGPHQGSDKPVAAKQFVTVGGVPVLVHSLRAFAGVARVAEVLVAVRATEMERVHALVTEYGLGDRVRVVEGGENRQGSVGKGLAALACEDDDVVLVHDAVRPLIDGGRLSGRLTRWRSMGRRSWGCRRWTRSSRWSGRRRGRW